MHFYSWQVSKISKIVSIFILERYRAQSYMEHFLEWIASLRQWYDGTNGTLSQMRRVTNTNLLNSLPRLNLLQENVSWRNLLNAKPPFLSLWKFAFNKVNNWGHDRICITYIINVFDIKQAFLSSRTKNSWLYLDLERSKSEDQVRLWRSQLLNM